MNFEIYNKNLLSYENRYGKYEEIKNNKYENKLEVCKDGNKTLKINNIYLNSKYNPIKEAKRVFIDFNSNYSTNIIYFGFGLSYYITELLNKINISDEIIIYEKDKELFDIVMKNIDISNILENKNMYLVFNINEIKQKIMGINNEFIIDCLPVYKDLYTEEYVEFLTNCKGTINDLRANLSTIEAFKKFWSRNIFSNLKYILNSFLAQQFKDLLKDKPVVVVGAGPSLNKNVHLLKKLQGKVCIICAFSASKVLRNNNIIPNFLATIDSKQYGITDFEANIPLIYIKEANTNLLKEHTSKKVLSLSFTEIFFEYILDEKFNPDNISMGGTVTSLAAGFAQHLGASEIIVIGQDFSWTKEKIHAEGTEHRVTEGYKLYHNYNMEKEDIYGNKVYSNFAFMSYKRWFDEFTKHYKKEGLKVIQATEGGLPIEEAETLTLQEAIDKYCINKYCDIDNIFNKFYSENNLLCVTNEEEENIYNRVKQIYIQLKIRKELTKEATILSKKLFKNIKYNINDLKINNKIIKRLDEIDKVLKSNEIVKSLMAVYTNDINSYFNIKKTDNEKLDFAIMNKNLYNQIDNILKDIIRIAKEEMGYED